MPGKSVIDDGIHWERMGREAFEQLVDNLGVVAGVLLLAGSLVTALGPWGRARAAAAAPQVASA